MERNIFKRTETGGFGMNKSMKIYLGIVVLIVIVGFFAFRAYMRKGAFYIDAIARYEGGPFVYYPESREISFWFQDDGSWWSLEVKVPGDQSNIEQLRNSMEGVSQARVYFWRYSDGQLWLEGIEYQKDGQKMNLAFDLEEAYYIFKFFARPRYDSR